MGKLLEQAIEEARKLPEEDQELLAWVMLEEIDDQRRWDEVFSRPPSPALERMMEEALEDDRAGRTKSRGRTLCAPTERDIERSR